MACKKLFFYLTLAQMLIWVCEPPITSWFHPLKDDSRFLYFVYSVYVAKLDSSTGDILERGSPVTTLTGNQVDDWNIERLTISADPTYKLVFELIKGL